MTRLALLVQQLQVTSKEASRWSRKPLLDDLHLLDGCVKILKTKGCKFTDFHKAAHIVGQVKRRPTIYYVSEFDGSWRPAKLASISQFYEAEFKATVNPC